MALRLSTGTRNGLASTSGLKDIFEGGFIGVFTGGQPTTADNAETGSKLMEVSLTSGTGGITFGTAGAGILPKAAGIWSGTIGTGGVAGWFRLYDADKGAGSNGTARRIDGNIGVSGSDLVLANTTLVVGATLTIDTFSLEVPSA
jgi:hypothetical protein